MMVLIIFIASTSINGFVHNDAGQALQDANVTILGTHLGAATCSSGVFSIENISYGRYLIEASVVGHKPETVTVIIKENKPYRINFVLTPTVLEMESVVITDKIYPIVREISSSEINDNPEGVFIQRVIASSPGVGTIEDYSGQICVWGGDPDENLTIIDGIEFPYPTHFGKYGGDGGSILIVPNAVVDKVDFYPGGFPAEFGGKLSSVMDIKLKQTQKLASYIDFNIGDMTWTVFSPYGFASYRKSHLGVINRLQEYVTNEISYPEYTDVFGKASLRIGEKNTVSVIGLKANDELYFKGEYDIAEYGLYLNDIEFRQEENQHMTGLIWQYSFLENGILTTSLSMNSLEWYAYQMNKGEVNADIHSMPTKVDMQYERFKMGLSYKHLYLDHYLVIFPDTTPTNFIVPGDTVGGSDNSNEVGGYLTGNFSLFRNVSIIPGLRIDYFGLIKKTSLNPRIGIHAAITDATSINTAFGRFSQAPRYEYLIINPDLSYENAYHFVCGAEHFFDDKTKFTINAYMKLYSNLISLPTDSIDYLDIRKELDNSQQGYAAGGELTFKKHFLETFTLNLGYAYSISKRKLEDITYCADWDQRHILNIMLGHALSDFLSINIKWRYASGRPYTPVLGREQHPVYGMWLPILGDMNSERLPDYHRLDGNILYKRDFSGLKIYFYLNIWNLYNHKNILTYVWDDDYRIKQEIYQFLFTPVFGIRIEF